MKWFMHDTQAAFSRKFQFIRLAHPDKFITCYAVYFLLLERVAHKYEGLGDECVQFDPDDLEKLTLLWAIDWQTFMDALRLLDEADLLEWDDERLRICYPTLPEYADQYTRKKMRKRKTPQNYRKAPENDPIPTTDAPDEHPKPTDTPTQHTWQTYGLNINERALDSLAAQYGKDMVQRAVSILAYKMQQGLKVATPVAYLTKMLEYGIDEPEGWAEDWAERIAEQQQIEKLKKAFKPVFQDAQANGLIFIEIWQSMPAERKQYYGRLVKQRMAEHGISEQNKDFAHTYLRALVLRDELKKLKQGGNDE